jgi:hypothetical protein
MPKYPLLSGWFDHIYVINCAHRPDRKKQVVKELEPLADMSKVTLYPGVIGDYTTHPAGFNGGRGAWGCLQSHRRIYEDIMHMRDSDGALSWRAVLILEDDVYFLPGALRDLELFMLSVPDGWGQLYLGGQHRKAPIDVGIPHVIGGASINRTHAYAVSAGHVQAVYRHVSYMADYANNKYHIDHQLERAHQRGDWPVYCPPRWICGQRAGSSNVSGRKDKNRVWQPR